MTKIYIIAEAGVNHNGDMQIAKKLIETAKEVGADAIKFQHFYPNDLVCTNTPKSKYQKNDKDTETQLAMLNKLCLSNQQQMQLYEYANKLNINYLCTPFDYRALDFLITLNLKYMKFSSGDLTNIPLLKRAIKHNLSIILSTGMAKTDEIKNTLDLLNYNNIHLLHCTSAYPTLPHQVNLQSIAFLKHKFGLPVGFSDHTIGTTAAIGAVGCGAHIIEKHLTLDNNLPGPDHKASANKQTFLELVQKIREAETMLGDYSKTVQTDEMENRHIGRRSLVLIKPLKIGQILKENNIIAKRPNGGIQPQELQNVIGKKAKINIKNDTPLLWDWLDS